MKRKINIGWIGSGFIGQVAHLYSFSQIKDLEILSLAELRPELGKQIKRKYNIKNLYKSHIDLLKDNENLDGIVSIVRRYHTFRVAKDVLRNGFNLFTEKPMAMTYQQSKTLVNLAKKKSLVYSIGNMRRFDDGVTYAKEYFDKVLKTKKLGTLNYFKCYCFGGYDYCNIDQQITTNDKYPNYPGSETSPKWLSKNQKRNYERFLAFFVHDLNLINYFFEKKYKVKSFLNKNSGGVVTFDYDSFYGIFDFAYGDQRKWEEKLEIFFSKGKIEINLKPAFLRNQNAEVKIFYEGSKPSVFSPKIDWSWSFKNQASSFIESIRRNKSNKCSGKESLKDMEMAEKIWRKV